MKYTASRNTAQNQNNNILGVISVAPEVPGPNILTASAIDGLPIVNMQEENIGKVDHIMIDVPAGQIAYIVVSSGGVLGVGSKLHAIPWTALMFDAQNNRLLLDIDKKRLESAPGFDKDHWPSMADIAWGTEIHDYYGQRNYWLRPSSKQVQAS